MKEFFQVVKKQVDQKLSQSCRKSLNITKTPANLDIVIIAAIFDKFNDRYLNKFSSQIAGREIEIINEWSVELAGLTDAQIEIGMTWREEWPPNMYEFKDLCVGKELKSLHSGPAYQVFDRKKLIGTVKSTPESCKEERKKALEAAGL